MYFQTGRGFVMIHSRSIPFTAEKFVSACKDDVALGRYAPSGDYLEFLIKFTRRKDPRLLSFIRVLDRSTGQPRYFAEADHIVPQAVWFLLMQDRRRALQGSQSLRRDQQPVLERSLLQQEQRPASHRSDSVGGLLPSPLIRRQRRDATGARNGSRSSSEPRAMKESCSPERSWIPASLMK